MKRMVIVAIVVVALGGVVRAGYEWRGFADDPDEVALFRDGVQVGGYRFSSGVFRPYDVLHGWGSVGAPPVSPPRRAEAVANYGVDWDRLENEGFRLDGRKVGRAEAVGALAGPLPDDAALHRLTVCGGTADERKKVLDDLEGHPSLAAWKGRLVVQAYPAGHWALAAGHRAEGRPTIYLQTADGRVLHRQDDYAGGADALAGALRKADPSYRPERDRDWRSALLPRFGVPWSALAVGGAAALVFIRNRRGNR